VCVLYGVCLCVCVCVCCACVYCVSMFMCVCVCVCHCCFCYLFCCSFYLSFHLVLHSSIICHRSLFIHFVWSWYGSYRREGSFPRSPQRDGTGLPGGGRCLGHRPAGNPEVVPLRAGPPLASPRGPPLGCGVPRPLHRFQEEARGRRYWRRRTERSQGIVCYNGSSLKVVGEGRSSLPHSWVGPPREIVRQCKHYHFGSY